MDAQIYTSAVRSNGERLLSVAADSPDAAVRACPGWDVSRLVGHVGQVHARIAHVVAHPSAERPNVGLEEFPDDPGERVQWAAGILERLLAALEAADPEARSWNWAGTGRLGFFHRRMAHETVVHRWDAEDAVGDVTAIDSDLGADGVDELIDVGMQHSSNPETVFEYPAGSLHLHRTDGDGEWLLRTEDGRLVVTREHAKGDVAVRGTGDNLLLYLWGRGGNDLEIFGDADLAAAWSRVAP